MRSWFKGELVGEVDQPQGDIKAWLEDRLRGCQERFDRLSRDPLTPNNAADRALLVGSMSVCQEALHHLERIEKWDANSQQ